MSSPTTHDPAVLDPSAAMQGAGYRRAVAVLALAATPLLSGLAVLLQPDLDGDATARLEALADGPQPVLSAVAFLLAQLPTIVTMLAIGHLVRARAARLSSWGVSLGVLGAFGHTAFGGTSLVYVVMAREQGDRAAFVRLLDEIEAGPVMLVSVVGLAGTVVGLLLLSIALYRTRTGPRWVGPVLWAFLVVEFAGTSLSSSASYLSVLLFAAVFLALALHVARGPLAGWAPASTPVVSAGRE